MTKGTTLFALYALFTNIYGGIFQMVTMPLQYEDQCISKGLALGYSIPTFFLTVFILPIWGCLILNNRSEEDNTITCLASIGFGLLLGSTIISAHGVQITICNYHNICFQDSSVDNKQLEERITDLGVKKQYKDDCPMFIDYVDENIIEFDHRLVLNNSQAGIFIMFFYMLMAVGVVCVSCKAACEKNNEKVNPS